MTQDTLRQTLAIHQLPPEPLIRVRIPNAFRLDLNVDAGVLCGRYSGHVWRMDLASRQILQHDLPHEMRSINSWAVVTTRTGQCATAADDSSLLILDGSGAVHSVRLELPEGQQAFDWQDLAYDDALEMLLLTGRRAYAVIPATDLPARVSVKGVYGKLQAGSIENTHFSGFRCCARLGAGGELLYTVADLGDDDMSGFPGLVAINVASGQYRRMYLPFAPEWQQTGRHISRFDHPWFELAGSTDYALWRQGAGTELVLEGFADFEDANDQFALLKVDVDSGNVEAVPRGLYTSLEGVSRDGRHLFWRDAQDQTVVTDAATQAEVSRHPGVVVAVAHARSAETRMTLSAADGDILTYRSSRPVKLGINRGHLSTIASWLRSSRSLEGVRLLLQSAMSLPDPETGRKTFLGLDEVIVHAQGLPLPRPEVPMPRLAAGVSAEDARAWADYAAECDTFAASQGEEASLALLQCLVAPW